MIKTLINLKKTKAYKLILLIIWLPVYEIIWQFIINFDRKIIYYRWKLGRNINSKYTKNLKKNFYKIVKDDEDFKKISDKINNALDANNSELSKLIDKKFVDLQSKEISNNVMSTGEKQFNINFFEYLDDNLKKEILNLSISDKMLSIATDYMKVYPVLAKVIVYKNYPTKFPQRGSMLWHKDDFGYKSLDLFLNISNVDDDNGPLHVLKKNDPLGVFSKSIHEISNPERGERGKLDSDYINENENTDKICKLLGYSNGLLVDSFRVYHRGGHCKNNTRLMLRFSYQTKDCLRLNDIDEKSSFVSLLSEKQLNNFFVKRLLFYKSNNVNKFVKNLLMKLYRILHYKKVDLFS